MIKINVEFSEFYGLVVTDIRGTKSAIEWIANEVQKALCFDCHGLIVVNWSDLDFPADLRKRIILVQSIGA